MIRTVAALLLLVAAACTNSADLDEAPADLGNFKLGHNIVVASKMKQAGLSRQATEEQWVAALTQAVDERFGRYDGDRLYHIGISVEGFSLAPPGVPIVVSPKSVLIFRVTLWDDALGRKLNESAKQFTVFESFSGDTLVGSGLTKSADEQMQNLSRNAAKVVETWMLEHPDWFPGRGSGAMAPAGMAETPTEAAEIAAAAPAE